MRFHFLRNETRPVQTRFRYGSFPHRELTSPVSLTRRIIMQKARRHQPEADSDRL